MIKKLIILALAPLIVFSSLGHASAATNENINALTAGSNIAQCNGGFLTSWDWPTQIQTLPHQSGSKTPDASFDPSKTDYILYLSQTQANGNYRNEANGFAYQYSLIDGYNLTLYTINGQTYLSNKTTTQTDAPFQNFTLIDSSKPTDPTYFPLVVSDGFYSGLDTAHDDPTYHKMPIVGSNIACIAAAHGVVYDPSYTGPKFKSSQSYTLGSSAQCSKLNISCQLATAFQTVTQNIADFVREVMQWFVDLWVPSGDVIKSRFDDFGTFMSVKLGFLLWPFEFLADVFGTFGGAGTWCSPSNCSWSGSTMYGGHLTFDVLALAHSGFAPLWNYGLLFIRGSTILILIGLLYRKFMEVTEK